MSFRSAHYDDIYFSAQDGLSETRHVFLDGNTLEDRLPAIPPGESFTIAETGFGTGLNFLASWEAFRRLCQGQQKMHFISVEKHPLTRTQITQALSPWHDTLTHTLPAYLAQYPSTVNTTFSAQFDEGNVTLTVLIGDATQQYKNQTFQADCWFLDGFRPACNPDMWTPDLLTEIARLTRPNGTLASFTAAGFVRRSLQHAGFAITKRQGFGRKREMITGRRL